MIEIIETEPDLLQKIHTISEHYSKKSQWEKAQEEVEELLIELQAATNPFGIEECVYLADNTWSEIADVLIMCIQLIMQHGAADKVRQEVEFKVERQLRRIQEENITD